MPNPDGSISSRLCRSAARHPWGLAGFVLAGSLLACALLACGASEPSPSSEPAAGEPAVGEETPAISEPTARPDGEGAEAPDTDTAKPHRTVVLLGHPGHGQQALARAWVAGDEASPPTGAKAASVPVTFHDLETSERRYRLAVPSSTGDLAKSLLTGSMRPDSAVLVVSAADGPMPPTRDQLDLARSLGVLGEVTDLVVFLSQVEQVDDAELLDLVELETRELLTSQGFAGPEAVVAWGSAKTGEGVEELRAALDEMPLPVPPRERSFLMPVEEVFFIEGRGTVVTGRVERGRVEVGDEVEVVGLRDLSRAKVAAVEQFNQPLSRAEAGDNVGLLLGDIPRDALERGQVVAEPGTQSTHTSFQALAYLLTEEEGGRGTPVTTGDELELYLRTVGVAGLVRLPQGVDQAMPGDVFAFTVELTVPMAVEPGLRFALRQDGRTLGAGVVTEVLTGGPSL